VTQLPAQAPTIRASGRMRRPTKTAGPQPYDFRRPIKLSREHIRALQIAYETFARGCGTLLTTRLRAVSQISLLAIEQLTYEEYVSTLNSPTVIAQVALEPMPGAVLLELSLSTAMACIDHLLGGPGGAQPERPLTDIELPLLRGLLERMLSELQYAFEQLIDVRPRLGSIEYNPQFVRVHGPSDAVVVASFEMRVGDEECVATVCLPFASILPVLQSDSVDAELSAAELAARRSARANLSAGLSGAPLEVAVRFRPVHMRASQVVQLRPGDIVPLPHPVGVPLTVVVNDRTFAHAVPGNQGRRLACLVVPAPAEENQR
jgi:flagellar motor switch protein FliM